MKRAYRMGVRAEAAERTTERIHEAALALFRSRPFPEVTLQMIANASGVTLQTVLRKFGSKERLFTEAAKGKSDQIFKSRAIGASDDIDMIVATIIGSYEEMGDLNWRGLSQEDQFPLIKEVFDQARARHRLWVENGFAGFVRHSDKAERERRVLLLFAATDFYVWKLYRRDLGMSRARTSAQMIDLVKAVLHGFGKPA